jgi:hypothetical protein
MRDEFPEVVKRILANRVGLLCSNPDCRASTAGPQEDPAKASNIGVAAHLAAASVGGPRYDPKQTQEQRQNIDNAIWLCQNCAKKIDDDPVHYTIELLRAWKAVAEAHARERMGKTASTEPPVGKVRVQLPNPINPVGSMSVGGAVTPFWSVRVRLINDGGRPLDIVELGVSEDGVEWIIDEVFREGKGGRVGFPIRLDPAAEFWLRARSPVTGPSKPASLGPLTVWCEGHTGWRHEHVVEKPEMG